MDNYTLPILSGGAHTDDDSHRCAMEHLAWVLGEGHTDNPATAWGPVASLVQDVNDNIAQILGEPEYITLHPGTYYERVVVQRNIPPKWAEQLIHLAWLTVGTREAVDRLNSMPYYEREAWANKTARDLKDFQARMNEERANLAGLYISTPAQAECEEAAQAWLDEATALLKAKRLAFGLPETVQSVYPMQTIDIKEEVAV